MLVTFNDFCKFDFMTVVTIELNTGHDLEMIQEFLTSKGLKFEVEDEDEWGNLPAEEIESIEAGMADFENGRVITHAEAMAQVNEHIAKSKTGG
jgi:hypothetical protein